MDDAGGGRRGVRATATADLVDLLARDWGIVPRTRPRDLGGSANLNLLIDDGSTRFVSRVYRPFVTVERLADVHVVREALARSGLPVVVPRPTVSGRTWSQFGDRLVEVEAFVSSTGRMKTLPTVEAALPFLGRTHTLLESQLQLGNITNPEFANFVSAHDLVERVGRGTGRIRGWRPTAQEAGLADVADRLADTVAHLQDRNGWDLDAQLVHGDFWDNNVVFRGDAVAMIGDFDFMGRRPRVEDLALTLYFVSQDLLELAENPDWLAALVTAYGTGLDRPLTEAEVDAIPVAMARQPLWSIAVWVALLDDEATARRHLGGTSSALRWGLKLATQLYRR